MLSRVIENTSTCNLDNRDMLREVTVKIGLERIDMQKGVTVKALLDSRATGLVMSLEFAKKQEFKLKKNRKINIYKKRNWRAEVEHDLGNTIVGSSQLQD